MFVTALACLAKLLWTKKYFLAFVKLDFANDYWPDVGVVEASELADELSEGEWDWFCENWKEMEVIAQTRFAEIASETSHLTDETMAMLLEMLSSDSPDIVEASIDSMNSISQNLIHRFDLDKTINLLKHSSPEGRLAKIVLASLLTRLEND